MANAVHGIINELIAKGALQCNKEEQIEFCEWPKEVDQLQSSVLNLISAHEPMPYTKLMGLLAHQPVFINIKISIDALRERLRNASTFVRLYTANVIVVALLLLLCVTRVETGLLRGLPIAYVSIATILGGIVYAAYVWSLTRLIESSLIPRLLRNQDIKPESYSQFQHQWDYYFLGAMVLLPSFSGAVQRQELIAGSDSGGSSSCGSGGDSGGGCGGCGGGD
jgi:uncharacterized membrane protein YgcG